MFVVPLSRSAALSRRAASPSFGSALDRLFDESFDRYLDGARTGAESRTPAMDVTESDTAYTIVLDVPGSTREQLKVSVEGRRVSIETVDVTTDAPADQPKAAAPRVLYRERSTARYARTVSLPAEVDQASSSAKFENGVLTLTLAKKVPTGALQISIS